MGRVLRWSESYNEDKVLKVPLFTFCDKHLVIKHKEEIIIFNMNEITNVRFSKKRNFSINILFLLFTLLIYSFVSDYFGKFFIYNVFSFLIAIISSVISLSIKKYTYVLFININHLGFKKLRLSKNHESYAKYFVSVFRNNSKKNKRNTNF